MSVRWITASLGTAAWADEAVADAEALVDVRSLRDASGNSPVLLAEKIAEIEAHVRAGRRTVVCCDYGKSRSNGLAAAVLARIDGSGFSAALERVIQATGERSIKVGLVAELRQILGERESPRIGSEATHVLLGGAEGFIGRAVRKALTHSGVPVIPLDGQTMQDAPALMERVASSSGARCLVFLTRPAVADSNDGLGELLAQLRNALEVCRACALGLIFLSGHQVFAGYPGSQLHPNEEFPSRPAGAIGEALYLCERLIELHVERDGLEALIVRACPTYGPGDSRPSFLRTFVNQAVRGEGITTHRYRNGLPVVELMHVRDFAVGMALAVRKRLTGRLHLGSGQGITTPALAQTIARLAGSTSSVRSVDLPGEPASIVLDASRARAALGWVASIPLEGGLSELLADIRPSIPSTEQPSHDQ